MPVRFRHRLLGLSYLQRFPFDTIKVDRDFVRQIASGQTAILRSIVKMASELNLAIVAEGCESEADAVALAELGCEYALGPAFGEPMTMLQARQIVGAAPRGGLRVRHFHKALVPPPPRPPAGEARRHLAVSAGSEAEARVRGSQNETPLRRAPSPSAAASLRQRQGRRTPLPAGGARGFNLLSRLQFRVSNTNQR